MPRKIQGKCFNYFGTFSKMVDTTFFNFLFWFTIQSSGAGHPRAKRQWGGQHQAVAGSDGPKASKFELSASHLRFPCVQFTKNHVCKAGFATKGIHSFHGIQNLASSSEKDYTVAFGELILAARSKLALLKQLSALPSFPHCNCKSLHGIAQSYFTPWKL